MNRDSANKSWTTENAPWTGHNFFSRLIEFPPYAANFLKTEAKFTDKELQVVAHLNIEKSNKRVGQALRIHEKTVKFHLTNVYKKMGVKNRVELFDLFYAIFFPKEHEPVGNDEAKVIDLPIGAKACE